MECVGGVCYFHLLCVECVVCVIPSPAVCGECRVCVLLSSAVCGLLDAFTWREECQVYGLPSPDVRGVSVRFV